MFDIKKQVAEPIKKVTVSVPISTLAWAKSLGEPAERSGEEVLAEAISYAKKSHESHAVSLALPDDVRKNAEVVAAKLGASVEVVLLDLLRTATAKAAKKAVGAPQ